MKNKLKILENIFTQVFGELSHDIKEDLTSDDIENWDSMNHLNLMMKIQEEFSVQFEFSDIISVESVSDILKLLKEKGAM